MSERILLKLGGSIITDKSGDCSIDHAALRQIAGEIAAREELSIIIIHGAGSCGHPEARAYGLSHGVDQQNREGIAITHEAVCRLNESVVAALREQGVEAVGIHPMHGCLADGGRLVSCEYRQLSLMLGLHIVPVLHGDVVLDLTRGACIISGDQFVRYLGGLMPLDRIGLATDVPGVLSNGQVVPLLTPERAGEFSIGRSVHTDVTGGMEGKVRELVELARAGVRSEIFHISRLGDFLDGTATGGTIIEGGMDVGA